jgi:hypothetical protein
MEEVYEVISTTKTRRAQRRNRHRDVLVFAKRSHSGSWCSSSLWFNPEDYQTKPFARRAGSTFRVQGCANFAKRTHSRLRCLRPVAGNQSDSSWFPSFASVQIRKLRNEANPHPVPSPVRRAREPRLERYENYQTNPTPRLWRFLYRSRTDTGVALRAPIFTKRSHSRGGEDRMNGMYRMQESENYQTKPCARRASSKFRVQGSKLSEITKRTHLLKNRRFQDFRSQIDPEDGSPDGGHRPAATAERIQNYETKPMGRLNE